MIARRAERFPGIRAVAIVRAAVMVAATAVATRAATAGPAKAPPLEAVVGAWMTARAWLDDYALPREHETAGAVAVPGAFGLSVLLRAGGEIVGRGAAAPADGLSLRRAMAEAMGEAWGGGLRSLAESTGDERIGQRLTLELEVAGDPLPLLGRTYADAARRTVPGIDGLAMRRDDRWALAYVGRLLATNAARAPGSTFTALAGELGLPARDLADLRAGGDVAVYRLQTVRLVQLQPGEMPRLLLRNDELVRPEEIDERALAALAAGAAERLANLVHRGESGETALLMGDYRAAAHDFRPAVAPGPEQALGALALLVYADHAHLSATIELAQVATECRTTALQILEALAIGPAPGLGAGDESPLDDPRTAALAGVAALTIPDGQRTPWLDALAEWCVASVREADRRAERAASGGARSPLGPHHRGMIAALLARAHREMPAQVPIEEAIAAAESAWEAVGEHGHAALLPWIVWAEHDLRLAGAERSRDRLLDLRDRLFATQVGFGEVRAGVEEPDLAGGFRFRSGSGEQTAPDAQSLRAIAGLAAMLGEPALSPASALAPLRDRQRAATRFLVQLSVRPPLDRLARRPNTVRHGFRNGLWDSDMPVAAQALGIIAAVETLRSAALGGPPGPDPDPAGPSR